MKIKLAVPNKPIFDVFIQNIDKIKKDVDIEIFRVEENQCADLLIKNRVQAAMLSPLGYGSANEKIDLRIIQGPALSTQDYTQIASVFFNQGLTTIENIAMSSEDFILKIGYHIIAERYDIHPKIKIIKGSTQEILEQSDAAIVWAASAGNDQALDISEEWFDSYELPLPLAFWVCRALEYPENIQGIVRNLCKKDIDHKHIFETLTEQDDYLPREGKLIFQWNDEIEHALEETLQFLFLHQNFKNISAVKILGRDNDNIEEAESIKQKT